MAPNYAFQPISTDHLPMVRRWLDRDRSGSGQWPCGARLHQSGFSKQPYRQHAGRPGAADGARSATPPCDLSSPHF